jgi:hypothetical protein
LKSKFRLFGIIFLLFWVILVLYPNPNKLVKTVSRLYNPPMNYFVEELKPILKESYNKTPQEIEEIVKKEIPYNYDWNNYGLPLYFPTVKEVMENKSGDCKSQFLITASVFDYYSIEYTMLVSPVHVWINYEGKQDSRSEREEITTMAISEEGTSLKVPKEIDWEDSKRVLREAFWESMPINRKIALYLGFFVSLFFFFPSTFLYSIIKKE